MVAEKDAALEDVDDLDVGQPGRIIKRGCYGRTLREGQVRPSPPGASRRVHTLLWVLNVVLWLLLGGFAAWRLYVIYMIGGAYFAHQRRGGRYDQAARPCVARRDESG